MILETRGREFRCSYIGLIVVACLACVAGPARATAPCDNWECDASVAPSITLSGPSAATPGQSLSFSAGGWQDKDKCTNSGDEADDPLGAVEWAVVAPDATYLVMPFLGGADFTWDVDECVEDGFYTVGCTGYNGPGKCFEFVGDAIQVYVCSEG